MEPGEIGVGECSVLTRGSLLWTYARNIVVNLEIEIDEDTFSKQVKLAP